MGWFCLAFLLSVPAMLRGKEIVLGLLAGLLLSGPAAARAPDTHHAKARAVSARVHPPTHFRAAHARSRQPADHRPIIVIDPGHGGTDPGAIGLSGTLEKTITLGTALDLRRVLLATGRYRVALTRASDRSVSLATRLGFARARSADMLIAIHADASRDHHARGASVYVRAGSAMANLEASAGLQGSMIEQLSDDVRMLPTPARAARLYVLAEQSIPSVLLEIGFLSNRRDEALLRQPRHRHIIVEAIKDAVNDYFATLRQRDGRT